MAQNIKEPIQLLRGSASTIDAQVGTEGVLYYDQTNETLAWDTGTEIKRVTNNDTTYSAGTGLTLSETTFSVDETWLGTQISTVVESLDEDTTYTAGDGLTLTGTAFSVDDTVVRTSGDQTIAGNKTFSGSVSVATPDASASGTEVVTAAWVRNNLASIISDIISDASGNALTVEDGKLKVIIVSQDEGNLLTSGSDGGAYTPHDYGIME